MSRDDAHCTTTTTAAATRTPAASVISTDSTQTTESTPLLSKGAGSRTVQRPWPKSVIYPVLLTAFLVSLSFSVTQVPLIFAVGMMTCEEYYHHHPAPPLGTPAWDRRCKLPAIDGSTAREVALLGAGTTFFGVANLFVTGWLIKVLGVKKALLVSIFWPALRLLIQNIGVMTGAGPGILILQSSQIITVVGGPAGYLLALNSFATEVVLPSERTAAMGRVNGVAMFGTGLGMLAGGVLSDRFGILTPFRVTLLLFCLSTVFAALALPSIPTSEEVRKKASKSLAAFFEPLKMFRPKKWRLVNGTVSTEYGVVLLGAGAFTAILATGYIPTLLQMYSIDEFEFSSTENSELVSLNFIVRAIFLTFAFPAIIDAGRARMARTREEQKATMSIDIEQQKSEPMDDDEVTLTVVDDSRLASTVIPTCQAMATEPEEPIKPAGEDSVEDPEDQSYAFDLLYARWSLLADGLLTLLAAFTSEGWQMYIVATVIPLAAGTGSAAKGTMLQMCAPEEKNDALSAITLVEAIARLLTISVFGFVFSAFVSIGQTHLTFVVNAAVAVIGFVILVFARFPPANAVRCREEK